MRRHITIRQRFTLTGCQIEVCIKRYAGDSHKPIASNTYTASPDRQRELTAIVKQDKYTLFEIDDNEIALISRIDKEGGAR